MKDSNTKARNTLNPKMINNQSIVVPSPKMPISIGSTAKVPKNAITAKPMETEIIS